MWVEYMKLAKTADQEGVVYEHVPASNSKEKRCDFFFYNEHGFINQMNGFVK